MRRAFIRATLLIVFTGLAFLLVALVWLGNVGIEAEAKARLGSEVRRIAAQLETRNEAGMPLTQVAVGNLAPADRQVTVRLNDGSMIVVGDRVDDDTFSASQTLAGIGRITVTQAPAEIRQEEWLSSLGGVGLVAVVGVASVFVARRQASRLVAPLADLVRSAERVGSGDLRPSAKRYDIDEFDQIGEALDRSAARINVLVENERALSADASHQLRTPLTALSMRLEEIVAAADDPAVVREEAAAALIQAERLSGVVASMLGVPQDHGHAAASLDQVVQQQLVEWLPAFAAQGRALVVEGESDLEVAAPAGPLAQVVATLVENALQHGGGLTRIRTRVVSGAAVVEIADEGQGIPSAIAGNVFDRRVSGSGGTGIGLATARATASSFGGRIELVRQRPTTFAIFLSAR